MIVSLDAHRRPLLLEAENLRALAATAAPGSCEADLAGQLGTLGTLDGSHVWLDIEQLKAMGPTNSRWAESFDAMIAFAQRSQWVSEDGQKVRAHLATTA